MEEEPTNKPRILIGGVPFGRGNVADEAVAEAVVTIVRELCPTAEISVSTDQEAPTRKRLSIKTSPLIEFPDSKISQEMTREIIRDQDWIIWAGAFGLSDYPLEALSLLDQAQQEGVKTIIFCVGQDSRATRPTTSGAKKALFGTIRFLTAGIVDLNAESEAKRDASLVEIINRVIPKTDLVILRDHATANELGKLLDAPEPKLIGADPMISLTCQDIDTCRFPRDTMDFLERSDFKIALSISSDYPAASLRRIKSTLDSLITNKQAKFLGIPLNPSTDTQALTELQSQLETPAAMLVLKGSYDPDEIMAATSRVDVVISDQRELLFLAANTLTPFVNLGPHSSSKTLAEQFGLPTVNNCSDVESEIFAKEIAELTEIRASFRKKAITVKLDMLAQLKAAKQQLSDTLNR